MRTKPATKKKILRNVFQKKGDALVFRTGDFDENAISWVIIILSDRVGGTPIAGRRRMFATGEVAAGPCLNMKVLRKANVLWRGRCRVYDGAWRVWRHW